MPDKLADHRQRVSLAEDIEIVEQAKAIARSEGRTLTDVYNEAIRKYLKQKSKRKTTNESKH